MFSANDIQERIRTRPFVPLRLVTTTGQTYDIYHPDLILVGRRDLIIGTASSENQAQYEQVTRVAILHVTELRDLPVATAPTSGDGTV